MKSSRAARLRKILDQAMGKSELHGEYIIKYDKVLEKRLKKATNNNKKLVSEIFNRLIEYSNSKFWRIDGQVNPGKHRSGVGTIDGLTINKVDVNQGTRMFIVRYQDEKTQLTYVMLVGFLLAPEREDTNEWRHEVVRICQRFGGEEYDDEEEPEDTIRSGNQIIDAHAGYLAQLDIDQSTEIIDHGLRYADTNITITYDQLEKIEKQVPLVVDGHAGTGKSVIIALRIALECIHAFRNDEVRKFLLIAYNERVVKMVRKYAETWMLAFEPTLPNYVKEYVTYETTLRLYRDLTKEVDREAIPDPNMVKSVSKLVNFYRFENKFFKEPHTSWGGVSPEQAWHFIRGVLKGSKHGWPGDNITIDDFRSISDTGKIHRRSTLHMDRPLIESLLEIFNAYEEWRKENNALDDIDLVRLASIALDNYRENKPDSSYMGPDYYSNFDIVFVDEAQDLTMIEFEVLNHLLEDHDKARFVIGGDPLQTINPTGFSWDAVEVFLYKILKDKIRFERMLISHRLTKTLVDFANVIIKKRAMLDDQQPELMAPSNELEQDQSNIICVPIRDGSEEQEKIGKFLKDVLGTDTGILIWARDQGEREEIIKKDPVLNDIYKLSKDTDDRKVILHSVESVKGLEYENVIFYRFGDLGESFGDLMKALDADEEHIDEEKYTKLYHLNRLFIAATRSKKNIYIFDSEDALQTSWNEQWWDGYTNIRTEFDVFRKGVDAKPSLDVARMYFDEARAQNDLNRATEALMIANRCPETEQRNRLRIDIEVLKISLEIELGGVNQDELRNKKLRLMELYSQRGDIEDVIKMRLELELWGEVHEEFVNGSKKLPKNAIFDFFKYISGLHLKQYTGAYLEEIILKHNNLLKRQASPLKESFQRRIREHVRKEIRNLSTNALTKLQLQWNYNLSDLIEWTQPDWDRENPGVCNTREKDYKKKVTEAFGKSNTWTANEQQKYILILFKNPHSLRRKEYNSRLAELGNTDAGKVLLTEQIEATTIWDINGNSGSIYKQILQAIDNGTYSDAIEYSNQFSALKPRLQFIRDYHQISSTIPDEWIKIFNKIEGNALKKDLTETITSDIPLLSRLGDRKGEIWAFLGENLLVVKESKRSELIAALQERLMKNTYALRAFNRKSELLSKIINIYSPSSLYLWTQGLEDLRKTATMGSEYDSLSLMVYCQAMNKEQAKKLEGKDKGRKTGFVNNVIWMLNKFEDMAVVGKHIHKFHDWIIKDITKKHEDIGIQLRMYKNYEKYKSEPEDFKEEEIDNLLTLAKIYDQMLYAEISNLSGRSTGGIDPKVFIQNFQTGELSDNDIIAHLNEDITFRNEELPWFKTGQAISLKVCKMKHDTEHLSPFLRLMYGAITGCNFSSTLLSSRLKINDAQITDEKVLGLLQTLFERVERRVELYTGENPFWEIVLRRDSILDENKPRKGRAYGLALGVIAALEILLLLKDSTNKKRVEYLRKSILPKLPAAAVKAVVIDQLFEHELFLGVFIDQDLKESAIDLLNG